MALVEPLVGYLLSKHADTVVDGLSRIRKCALANEGFATEFLLHPQGLSLLQKGLQRPELVSSVLQTVVELVKACDHGGVRSYALRDMCRGPPFTVLWRGLSALSVATLPTTIAALQFISVVATYAPKILLSRFGNTVPLNLGCFRSQLPYSLRRVRVVRAKFFIDLIVSSKLDVAESVLCTHGFLTHLLEDAAELLQEGTEAGVEVAQAALRVFGERFIDSCIPPAKKRAVLLSQKHTLRLLVKALGHPLVSESVLRILYRTVTELQESPADFPLMHVDEEDRGMPNRLLFFILKRLRPRNSPAAARLLIFILHQAPGLIRPYFTRASSHLEDESGSGRVSASIGTVSTVNVMTRAMLAPIPYHLAVGKAKLEPVEGRATTFFTMSPAHVAEEVCPPWVAEYVHRMINGSTDLLLLSFALQLTYAIMSRAKIVLSLVAKLQEKQRRVDDHTTIDEDNCSECDWDGYNAKVQAALVKVIPKWEEFWHRMTQQLHQMMLRPSHLPQGEVSKWEPDGKVMFLCQRMFMLMELYGDVFHLRMSWLSALPVRLPVFRPCEQPITDALQRGEVVVSGWPSSSIAALCSLLVSSLSRGVSMPKMHHITMSCPRGGVQEWPLLLSVIHWAINNRGNTDEEYQFAFVWVARLLQWTVHSVTVRFVCELEEAFLWLSMLTESTLPCFLHMINNLLQWSLSKTADRIAQELVHGDRGVIVNAARMFVAKLEAKALKQANGGDKAETEPRKGGATEKEQRGVGRRDLKACLKDLWMFDMQHNISSFKLITDRVERHWAGRVEFMKKHALSVYATSEKQRGKRQIALTLLQVEKEHRTLQPLHDQVVSFCRTLAPPTLVADDNEEAQLLERIRNCTAEDGWYQEKLTEYLSVCCSPTVWCCYPTVCWELASIFLRRVRNAFTTEDDVTASVQGEAHSIAAFGVALLGVVVENVDGVTQAILQSGSVEGNTLGFLFLLLVVMWTLLYELFFVSTPGGGALRDTNKDLFTPLSVMLLRSYSGTVSTTDRVRYGILLSMSYLDMRHGSNPTMPYRGEAMESDSTRDEGDNLYETDSDNGGAKSRRVESSKLLSTVLVPRFLMDNRFVIMDHQRAPKITPEVDMLSLIADTWTHEEVAAAALQCPVRLHNNILVSRDNDVGWALLRVVFPEFTTQKDVELASFDSLTAGNVMDPRYIVPLLHAVLAMPTEQLPRRNIGTKCIPLLLRSLSFTNSNLRRMGAAALCSVWTPSGPTRIVVGYARLKLTQLAAKRGRYSGNVAPRCQLQVEGDGEWTCPLLPTPISSFLIMGLGALVDLRHPMHNEVMNFLLATKAAFSDPVPLHRFLQSFPLGCITTPIMIKRQEDMRSKAERSSTVTASSEGLLHQLRAEAPIHLEFIIRLVAHGCQTCGDMKAMLHSESLASLTMLISMLAAADDVRLMLLRSVHILCTPSTAVGVLAVTEGQVLQWLLGFVQQLIVEYGKDLHLYGSPLFMEALCFLQKLASLAFLLPLYGQQVQQQVRTIRRVLTMNGVTNKSVLDAVDSITARLDRDEELTASGVVVSLGLKRRIPFPTNGAGGKINRSGRSGRDHRQWGEKRR